MNLLCRLGIHTWEPWNPPVLQEYRKMGVRIVRSRHCPRCNKANLVATK